MPAEAASRIAKVTYSWPDWKDRKVAPMMAEVAVDKLRAWDARLAKMTVKTVEPGTLHMKNQEAIKAIAYAPDGKTVAAGGRHAPIIWDVKTGTNVRVLRGQPVQFKGGWDGITYWSLAYSPDSRILAAACSDKVVRLWDTASGKETQLHGHKDEVRAVAFSPDGKRLASAGFDGVIRLWNVATGQESAALTGHQDQVLALSFSGDGKWLASAGKEGDVYLWDPVTAKKLHVLAGHQPYVHALAFSPDSKRLASAGKDGTLRLWDPKLGKEERALEVTLESHVPIAIKILHAVAFSPDGKTVATCGYGTYISLFEADTGKARASLPAHGLALAFSPDGATLAVADRPLNCQAGVHRWDLAKGRLVR